MNRKHNMVLNICCSIWIVLLLIVQYIDAGMPGARFLMNFHFFSSMRDSLHHFFTGKYIF